MLYSKLQSLFKYLIRIGDAVSQLLNVTFLFGQNANESISGRSYRLREQWFWWYMHLLINCLFFWQGNHCKAAYDADITKAHELIRAQARKK